MFRAKLSGHAIRCATLAIGVVAVVTSAPALAADFDQLVSDGTIARYDITPRQVIVYLLGIEAGEKLELNYQLS